MVFIWEHCGQLWAALLLPAWLKAAADFSLIPHSFRLWVHLLMCELLHAYKSLNNCWGLGGNPPPNVVFKHLQTHPVLLHLSTDAKDVYY